MINYKQYIAINSEIRFGKPIMIGTRNTVFDVLNWLANGMTIAEIVEIFQNLTKIKLRLA